MLRISWQACSLSRSCPDVLSGTGANHRSHVYILHSPQRHLFCIPEGVARSCLTDSMQHSPPASPGTVTWVHVQELSRSHSEPMCRTQICPCAASDHVTRILKEYGDVLDRYQLAPEKSDIGPELRVLRGLLLLIQLTGLLHA